MCDVPYGVLLSGGLDSSIISALAQRHSKNRIEDGGLTPAWWPQLHSFAIGLDGSPDLVAARTAAKAIGTIHHELHFTVQEGIDALSDVIYHIESFDTTTVRASTPMFLMARRIKSMGIKMVFTGEGSDEIFGGYLYFHKAPNAREFHEENVRKLDMLYKYDCLRANKSMAAWGLEARVPFLDREFLDVAMGCDAAGKMINAGAADRKMGPAQELRRPAARLDPVAPERAVLGRRRLLLDRQPEGPGRKRSGGRRARAGPFPLPDQHPENQGSVFLPFDLRAPLPQ